MIATYPASLRLHGKFFVQELDYRTENAETWGADAQEERGTSWASRSAPRKARRNCGANGRVARPGRRCLALLPDGQLVESPRAHGQHPRVQQRAALFRDAAANEPCGRWQSSSMRKPSTGRRSARSSARIRHYGYVSVDLAGGGERRFVRTGTDPLGDGVEELDHGFGGPMFFVDDPTATPLATLTGTTHVGLAVKRHGGWTSLYSGILPGGFTPRFLRAWPPRGGTDARGPPEYYVTSAGNGFLTIHALERR